MSVHVQWAPNTEPDIASYDIQSAAVIDGPWTVLVNIPHDTNGPNFDGTYFFYNDAQGQPSAWCRVIAIDTYGDYSSPSLPFQVTDQPPQTIYQVKIDHNYTTAGALRYQTAGGLPIEAAKVRLFTKAAFDQGLTDSPLAITLTDAQGNWVDPIYLQAGYTYVVQFAKEGLYGPDHVEIVV